jgi:hypothetical protein
MNQTEWMKRRQFMIEAEIALKRVADGLGVQVDIGQRTDGSQIWCKLEASAEDKRSEFELASRKFRFPIDWWQKEFMIRNELFRIVGARLSAEKNCLEIERVSDGKGFVCSVYAVDPMVHLKKVG